MQQDSNITRIIFWNVNKNDLTNAVCSLASSTMADVIVLNENKTEIGQTLCALQENVSSDFYIPSASPLSKERFHCFCRNHALDLSEIHSGFRSSVRQFRIGSKRALLALVHGVDMRNYDAETRQSFAQSLAIELRFVKEQQQTNKVILLGDFNMNPYDKGMTLAAGLNAMMTRDCVAPGVRQHLNETYEFYYNPMWSLMGDHNNDGPSGTAYDTSNQGPYGWNMLDQVLINHSIVDLFHDVEIITKAGDISLMDARGRPDARHASDHFPILVSMKGGS
jgi:exonuclease III